jgi:outer membrane protein assembly factor BamB
VIYIGLENKRGFVMKIKLFVSILLLVVLLACSQKQSGSEWPMFKGNYQRTSYSHDPGPQGPPQLVWQTDLKSHTPASLSLADNKIFIGHRTGVSCLGVNNGELIWNMTAQKSIFPAPTYYKGDIYFGSKENYYYRLKANDGEKIWAQQYSILSDCSPLVIDSMIYYGDFYGDFFEMDMNGDKTGRFYQTANWIVGSAAFDGEAFYFGSRDSSFYAVNRSDFGLKWEFNAEGDISSSPAVNESSVFFAANNMKIFSLDKNTGGKNWEFDTRGAMFSSPAIHNGQLFCGSTDSTLYCLNSENGELLWQYQTDGMIYSSATINDKYVYIGSMDGGLYCFDRKNGSLQWIYQTEHIVNSTPVIYGNSILFSNDMGIVFRVR